MKYFNDFNKIEYTLAADGKQRTVTNIFHRFQPIKSVLDRVTLFYPHTVKDHETPEMVSHTYYGATEYAWIIQAFNQHIDRYFDWPMSYDVFNKYIENKYGSEQAAKQTVKYYYHDICKKTLTYDGKIIPEIKNIIDYNIYTTLDNDERSLEYVWDWEDRLNEARRQIKIIDAVYINQILREKEAIFNG